MSQDSHSKRSRTSRKPPRGVRIAWRVLLVAVVVSTLAIAGGLLLRTFSRGSETTRLNIDLGASPSLSPLEAVALGAYLTANRAALSRPAESGAEMVLFTVAPGEHAGQVAANLQAQGVIADAELFRIYLRYYGLDVALEAGTYEVSASMTIPEIAYALTEAGPAQVDVRIPEGWRLEQIADWLDEQDSLPFGGAEFLIATGSTATLTPEWPLPAEIPPGATLEGFIFPDTYRLAVDSTAEDLVERALRRFDERVTPQMRADAQANGMTLYEVVTLASIVEREAAVAEERPLIAGVYLNRLAAGMKLEADPTVQYAMGYQPATGQWWNLNLTQADYYAVDSPYNTYLYPGLPPTPIASPGLGSIQAVIYPAETPYLYFRAACDGSGKHNFALTYEEHLANECP